MTAITDRLISELAREIARNIRPTVEVRESFKLSIEEFDEATETPFFQNRLVEEVSLWNDPSNARTRISAKAATMIEESLVEIHALIHDRSQPMAAKVQALQAAARWAGLENNPNVKGGGDDSDRRVRITINVNGKSLQFEKEKAKAVDVDAEVVSLSPPVTVAGNP